jgi:hypothetical protein
MAHQLVHLFERTFIQQQIDALARQQLPLLMLPLDARFSAARIGIGVTAANFSESIDGHCFRIQRENSEFGIQNSEEGTRRSAATIILDF